MKSLRTFVCGLAIACVALCLPSRAAAQDVSNLYTGGVGWNSAGNPQVDGSATWAHELTATGLYTLTKVDLVPSSAKPFEVVTNIGTGVGQRVATVAGFQIFCLTDAGVSLTGTAVGWGYTAGCGVPIKWRPYKDGALYFLPTARFRKDSVGGGGYLPLFTFEVGFGR